MRSVDDMTAVARIRDVALERFPLDGFEKTTIRVIAEDAGVSPALVVHHFGSKEGLRSACDAHVIERIRTVKSDAIEGDKLGDSATMSASLQMAGPLMRYLGWALTSGSEAAARVFDEMIEETVALSELAAKHGAMQPSPDPRARAAVQLAMQFGALTMNDHVGRALGVDPLSTEGVMRIARASLELFSGAMFAPGKAAEMLEALDQAIERTRRESN
jgi:TetR/AcrR family transcriptional regulator, regulator of cefoperazone and chloramphenicol sensitivity